MNGLVCDVVAHTCEPATGGDAGGNSCTSNDQSSNPAPICTQGMCVACKLDDECSSGVCRSEGACEDPANVLYVSPSGISAGDCPTTAPCEISYAKGLVTQMRYSLRAANGTYSLANAFVVGSPIAKLEIVGGRGAVFERTASGPSFTVLGGSRLVLRGITLHRGVDCNTGTFDITRVAFGTPGAEVRPWITLSNCTTAVIGSDLDSSTSYGIDSSNGGILDVSSTTVTNSTADGIRMQNGTLTIDQCALRQSMGMGVQATTQQLVIRRSTFYANRLGGISSVDSVFDVTNNFVYRNGNAATSTFGGMRLDTFLSGNRVEYNTVVRNDMDVGATPVYAGGIYCKGGGTSANNLIANNFRGNEFDSSAQTGGTCTFTGSKILASDSTAHFVSAIAEPFDYHLADAQSEAVNIGIPSNPPITEDFDGDARSDGMPDVGADELHP